jgi:hypothetical protein
MSSIRILRACASAHLARYTHPGATDRAFNVYDRQGDPNLLAPVDCLAPVMLNVPITWEHVVRLFHPSDPAAVILTAMQGVLDDSRCAAADFSDLELNDQDGPWALVDAALCSSGDTGQGNPLPRFKGVAVTKILHRKRPALVPILDRYVFEFYTGAKLPRGSYLNSPRKLWPLLQAELRDNRDWLANLAGPVRTPDGRPLSILRAADIIVWEHMWNGGAADQPCSAAST